MSYGQQAVMNSSFSGKIAANRQVTRQVTGRVIDASTKEPIIGVRIQAFNNQQYAAMSGEDGSFSIQLPSFVTSLSFSAEGYNLVVCPINLATNQIQVSLYSDVFTSFYEKQRKATIEKGTAVSNLNADLSIDRQIQTGLGGDVRAIMRSGQQGLGAYLLMNGINSLNANAQPLIVIDGVIMDMQYNRMAIHDGFYNHILTNISVGDIENVTVLKNGTALYGAKGANGVILINTKN
jgi:TonB-dependent SusC/RagA subfamily outer membrane receptor